METPVVIIVYKRPELAKKTLEKVALAKPDNLYVIADGPKSQDDMPAIEATREIFNDIPWTCNVHRNFAGVNMGLRGRIESGLDWVFSQADRAIILEDDCIPNAKFFEFCEDMLSLYADEPRMSMISGDNAHGAVTDASFYCSRYTLIWGWATWARAWAKYDHGMTWWPAMRDSLFVNWIFRGKKSSAYWNKTLQDNYEGANSWARVWMMTNWLEETVCAVSAVNLISNVGFGEDATHTSKVNAIRSFAGTTDPLLPIRSARSLRPCDKADAIADRVIFSRDDLIFRGGASSEQETHAMAAHDFLTAIGAPTKARISLVAAALRPASGVSLDDLCTRSGVQAACESFLASGAAAAQRAAVEVAAKALVETTRSSRPSRAQRRMPMETAK